MPRSRSLALGGLASLCLAIQLPSTALAYQLSDLQGTWELSSIASGPGAPWWERARATIAADGSFTASTTDHLGGTGSVQGQFALSSVGIVTFEGPSTFRGALDRDATVLIGTDTWTGWASGTTELKLGLKMAPTYALSDLAGDWEMNIIASGPGAPWWQRGRVSMASNGAFSGTLTDHLGQAEAASGSFGLTSGGVLTFTGSANARGTLDAHKTVLCMTSTWTGFGAGTAELAVGVKMGTGYTLADLVGAWEVHSLATGPGAPHWTRTHVLISPDGSFLSTASENGSGVEVSSGTVSITPNGVITRSGEPTARGVLDAGRTTMVWTAVWSTGSPGTTEIEVATRTRNATAGLDPGSRLSLALSPMRPNPARGNTLRVEFTLPDGAPARLELLDVSGRMVASDEVGMLGAGRHVRNLRGNHRLAPGVYLVRLTRGADSRVARVVALD